MATILQDPELALEMIEAFGEAADSQTLIRVATQLPRELVETLFGEKSKTNDIIIDQILKNKKIDLKNVA